MTTVFPRTVSRRWRVMAIAFAAVTALYVGLSRGAAPSAAAGPTVQLYDVRDVLASAAEWADRVDPRWRTRSASSCIGYTTNLSPTNGPSQPASAAAVEQDQLSELRKLVEDNVQPESWLENGGEGEFRFACGHLLVRLTPDGHRDLAAFLGRLRSSTRRPVGR